jgi:hypothetical protein
MAIRPETSASPSSSVNGLLGPSAKSNSRDGWIKGRRTFAKFVGSPWATTLRRHQSIQQPRSEMEALMALQIVATGLSGLRFLRQSQHHMDESFIEIYGGYAMKLLKMQNELLQTLDRHRRGHKQSVQARDVHIHSGAQGWSAS